MRLRANNSSERCASRLKTARRYSNVWVAVAENERYLKNDVRQKHALPFADGAEVRPHRTQNGKHRDDLEKRQPAAIAECSRQYQQASQAE